jgi:hypothetical protein
MKKPLLFFAMAALALMSGCGIADYGCNTYFKVINQTGNDIIVEVGRIDVVYETTSIGLGKGQTIYDFETLCGKNHVVADLYSEEEQIENLFMKINGNNVSDAIWKRKYWNFASKPYETTFTLTLTNALLEEMQQ